MQCVNVASACLTKPDWSRWPRGLWPWERRTHITTHQTKQTPDLTPHTFTQEIHPGDRPLPVCMRRGRSALSQTNRGNPPCLALSITGHLTVPAHVGACKPPHPPARLRTQDTHIHKRRPLGSSRVPLTQGHTQAGSLRRGLCQFASLRTLRVWPSLDQAASSPSISP